jgi:hypothetical protein
MPPVVWPCLLPLTPVRRKEIVYLRTVSERKHRSKEETLTARLERWIQRTPRSVIFNQGQQIHRELAGMFCLRISPTFFIENIHNPLNRRGDCLRGAKTLETYGCVRGSSHQNRPMVSNGNLPASRSHGRAAESSSFQRAYMRSLMSAVKVVACMAEGFLPRLLANLEYRCLWTRSL